MRCKCKNISPGSYDRQIWVHAPNHMPKDNGYCLDLCIAQEVMQLWMHGIFTNGCCCGHNVVDGYIGVECQSIDKMVKLGYEKYIHPDGQDGYFKPKYNMVL